VAGIAFASPAFARQRIRITGVCTAQHSGKGVSQLRADLVVDAIGRGARTPVMLERLGYGRPAVDKVTVHLKYSTQLLRLPPDALREMGFIVSPIPGRPRRLALALCEHGTYMLTVFGMAGDDPPDTFTEMLEFARAFAPPHAMAALESATPLAPPAQHRHPSSRWYRYDRAQRLPDGSLVVGDAVCSFNPIYAQGMTVAALEALALRDCLSKGTADLPRRFFRASAKPIRQAWHLAVAGDLALPEIEGAPPLPMRLMNTYVDRILTAAEYDISVF
jgi:2-polyprenyl-6-methoxyphenol hydroxylase-like FAD-dependent oxidoreductase